MSYSYSNELCEEALRFMNSNDEFESRLFKAFSEMGVSEKGDTSDEIWKEWKELEKKYKAVSGEIYQERTEGINTEEMKVALRELGEALVVLIGKWMRYNNEEISKANLKEVD